MIRSGCGTDSQVPVKKKIENMTCFRLCLQTWTPQIQWEKSKSR